MAVVRRGSSPTFRPSSWPLTRLKFNCRLWWDIYLKLAFPLFPLSLPLLTISFICCFHVYAMQFYLTEHSTWLFPIFWPMVTNDTLWTLSGFKCISRFYIVWFCDYWSKFVLASLGGMGVESLRVDWLIIFPNKAGRDIQNGSTKWHHRNTRTMRKKSIMTSPKDHTFQPPNSKRWTGKVTQ